MLLALANDVKASPKTNWFSEHAVGLTIGGSVCVLFTLALVIGAVGLIWFVRRRRAARAIKPTLPSVKNSAVVAQAFDLVESAARDQARADRLKAERQLEEAKRQVEQLAVGELAKSLVRPTASTPSPEVQ